MKNFKSLVKSKLLNSASAFSRDESGSFAVMSAVTMVMLVGALAIGIDIAQGWSAKQRLQDTTDAIALLAARGQIESQADLNAAAQEYFDLTYPGQAGTRIALESITRNGDAVTVTASNTIDTTFATIFGRRTLEVGAESVALYANRSLDIAMVLDTTFSMDGAKLSSLKASANGLMDTFAEFDNEELRVSVVPFAQYVNVGTSNRNAVWLDVPADEIRTSTRRDVLSRTNCRNVTRTGTNDGVTVTRNGRVCDTVRSEPYEVENRATWAGCVGSRTQPFNERVEYGGHKIPGLLDADAQCGSVLSPLSSNINTVKNSINGLVAQGETYMPAGLMWGWRMLNEEQPFPNPVSNSVTETDKIMVLMTDGVNTKSKNGLLHNGGSQINADNLTAKMCEKIKDENIRLFTIAYEVNDASTKNLLSGCATEAGNFFDARNASDLDDAFQAIGQSLRELRLTA